jgi:hypothetical protein
VSRLTTRSALRTARRRLAAAACAVVTAIGLVSGLGTSPAAAADAVFQPGSIMSDQVFYDSSTMTAAQIQTFLSQRYAGCDAGFVCVRDYASATPTRAAESGLCATYAGSTSESAAQILAKVAQACGVNPQVLLVLLQKESGLLTSTRPSYNTVTGFGCPDTAACNTSYYGFFNQVYLAARQFKLYRLNPNNYSYVAGRSSYILYNPNGACGGAQVYITNQATAGLYNYTPYQPNAAALSNLSGSGDSCSTFGNRNFWAFFNTWFGSAQIKGEDIVAVAPDGTARLYPNRGSQGGAYPYGLGSVIASGWGAYTLLAGGDANCDSRQDAIGVTAQGQQYYLPGRIDPATGATSYGAASLIGEGWQIFSVLMLADVDGDCRSDIIAITAAGSMRLYRNSGPAANGLPSFGYGSFLGEGWNMYTRVMPADLNGDGRTDILATFADGTLNSYTNWSTSSATALPYRGREYRGEGWNMYPAMVAKDVNGDGYSDILAIDYAGNMFAYQNMKTYPPYPPYKAYVGDGWSAMGLII